METSVFRKHRPKDSGGMANYVDPDQTAPYLSYMSDMHRRRNEKGVTGDGAKPPMIFEGGGGKFLHPPFPTPNNPPTFSFNFCETVKRLLRVLFYLKVQKWGR